MSEAGLKLARPPIVEAVLDVDCDIPPTKPIAELESPSRAAFREQYPKLRKVFVEQVQFQLGANIAEETDKSVHRAVKAFQFLHADEKQITQVRAEGFSFNRLAEYTSLDDYIPEIKRTWELFISIAEPVQVRAIRLRYINRLLLPVSGERGVDLDEYLTIAPRFPGEDRFNLNGFLHQQSATELATGYQVATVLAGQPMENNQAPVIFDITVESAQKGNPEDWTWLLSHIMALRAVKNHIFGTVLTAKCLNLHR